MLAEYESELTILKTIGAEFAKKYPERASSLGLGSSSKLDPNVERLIESVAFLNSQLKARLNSGFSELTEFLLREDFDQLLKPYPSCCIFEFSPDNYELHDKILLEKGMSFNVSTTENTIRTKFSSPLDITVEPIYVSNYQVKDYSGGYEVKFDVGVLDGVNLDSYYLSELLLFIDGPLANSMELAFAINNNYSKIYLSDSSNGNILTSGRIVDNGYNMLPRCNSRNKAVLNILDFYNFPEKNCFIKVELEDKIKFSKKSQHYSITLNINNILCKSYSLCNFKINAFPMINVWKDTSEPLNYTDYEVEHVVTCMGDDYVDKQIYSVDSVDVIDDKGEVYKCSPNLNSCDSNTVKYQIRKSNLTDKKQVFYIKLLDNTISANVISCDISTYSSSPLCDIAGVRQLVCQDIDGISISNISRPTELFAPPLSSSYQDNLLVSYTTNFGSLASIGSLKKILNLYLWQDKAINKLLIESIYSVNVYTSNKLLNGVLLKVVNYCIEFRTLDEEKEYLIFFFSKAIHKLISNYVAICSRLEMKVIIKPSNKKFLFFNLESNKNLI